MSQMRHTDALNSVMRWMKRTLDDANSGGQTVIAMHHVDTWHSTLGAIHADLHRREQAVIRSEAGLGDDVKAVNRISATRLVDSASQMVRLLAASAAEGADKEQLTRIDLAACSVIDALEILAKGVSRPGLKTPQTPTGA